MIGQTLSHFWITAELGEGRLGAVYRAEDTNLDREVAIKILPEAFTADAERLARFEREAKVLASAMAIRWSLCPSAFSQSCRSDARKSSSNTPMPPRTTAATTTSRLMVAS